MFDKVKFANIIKKIKDTYSTQEEFSKKSGIGRTYLSQYMNMKLDNPPKPEILKRMANNSNGVTTYQELMEICDYIEAKDVKKYYTENYNVLPSTYDDAMGATLFDGLSKDASKILRNTLIAMNENKEEFKTNGKFDIYKYLKDIEPVIKKQILKKYNNMKNAQIDILSSVINTAETLEKINNSNNITQQAKILNNYNNINFYRCPVYGKISAGQPNWAEECLEGYLPIDPNLMGIVNPEECFFLRVDR